MPLSRAAPIVLALVLLAPVSAAVAFPSQTTLLVGYASGAKAGVTTALQQLGAEVVLTLDPLSVVEVRVPAVAAERIASIPGVAFVEKDAATSASGSQWNGAQWDGAQWNGAQWNGAQWDGSSAATGGLWGHAAVNTTGAWAIDAGSRSVDLCVVDSGVDWTHPDLQANAWDLLGVHGFNAITATADATDDAGHGTHVAGIAAAVRDNGLGVDGVTASRIMSAKVLNASGRGTVSALALGMNWCADNGADVALLALSVDGTSQTITRAIDYLEARNVVIVASAGNVGPCTACVTFPANDPRVLAVTAVNASLALAPFSASGPAVDLAAPGVGIVSTFDGDGYAFGSGTSQAAAWVAGAAALVREHRPGLSAAQVRDALRAGATDLGPGGADDRYGAGLLNVPGALRAAEG